MTRLGHGPFPWFLGFKWPQQPFKWLLYDSRPDLLTEKTRAAEWKKLNTHWRYLHAILCYLGPPSHILWNIRYAWIFIMAISAGACIWQRLSVSKGFFDIDEGGTFKEAFRLTSFIMSLLLAFRLNRTYDRWLMARASVAGVGTGALSVFIQAATWVKDPQLVDDFRCFCIIWPYAVKQVVRGAKKLDPIAEELLYPEERAVYYGSRKGRQLMVTKIRAMVNDADLSLQQFISIEASVATTWRSAGDALRIKFQAMPHAVSLLCTGFVLIWCCLLPFGLTDASTDGLDWTAFVSMGVISLLLLAVDEVTTQLEDPFDLMPLDAIVSSYERDINRSIGELKDIQEATRAARQRIKQEALDAAGLEKPAEVSKEPASLPGMPSTQGEAVLLKPSKDSKPV